MEQIKLEVDDMPEFIKSCPVVFDWYKHKGEVCFASLNYEKSIETGKAWIDIHYCATRALNGVVEKTVIYRERDFVPHVFARLREVTPQNKQ